MNRNHFIFLAAVVLISLASFEAGAQWVQLGVPTADTLGPNPAISCIYVTNCELFAGTEQGLFTSTDGCRTWIRADSMGADLKIVALVKTYGSIFAGTDAGGIYRSEDNGITWHATDAFDSTLCMAVNDRCILAGNTRGIQRCGIDDSVWTWTDTAFPETGIIAITAHDSMVFAGSNYGAFRSTDYGKTWSLIDTNSLPVSTVTSFALYGDTVFATLLSGGVYRSTDNGIGWSRLEGLSASGYNNLIVIDSIIVVSTNENIYCSTDYGSSWFPAGAGLENKRVYTLYTAVNELYAGTELDGIWHRSVSNLSTPVIGRKTGRTPPQGATFTIRSNNSEYFMSKITFNLTAPQQVKVTIFDMHGCEILSPVNGYYTAGIHGIPWNSHDLASGFYVAKMFAGTDVRTTTLDIIR